MISLQRDLNESNLRDVIYRQSLNAAAQGLDDNSEEVSTRTRLEIATRLEEKIVAETPM